VLVLFGAAIVASLVLSKTVFGRYTFALGSNEEATRLSGVGVDAWKIGVYAVSGLFAGLAGVLIGARLNSAQPSLGLGYELEAIAAAVIGGTSLRGGNATVVGAMIGAVLLTEVSAGLVYFNVPQNWSAFATGAVILAAVSLDSVFRLRGRRSQDRGGLGL
jgi:ribose transport system permease protein